ncbi:hypothetical protein [Microbacterium sp. SA39]|uniref:hypothetical protein n=1 Tax=Microbacterium sp. SA39 TaxID=1263625 RepID=UPI0005FA4213|nr:hypothetical protein [Microbacterium sp. SA39]
MTPAARAEFAADVERALRATPGVRNVYRSGSLISHLLRAGAAALGSRDDGSPIVSVVAGDRGVVVEASVGIDFSAPANVTLRSAYTAVDAQLRAAELPRESITLTVVYVQPREAA